MANLISVEGHDLSEALASAAEQLGVDPSEVEFDYDRAHFANGASTIRIHAAKKGADNSEQINALTDLAKTSMQEASLEAELEIKFGLTSVHVQLSKKDAPVGIEAMDTFKAAFEIRANELIGERLLRLTHRDPDFDEDRGRGRDRDRDRGGRGGDRDRGRGRDRDRDRGGRGGDRDRGRGRDRDRDRGGRGGDRDRGRGGDRDRGDRRPKKDPERDEALRVKSREIASQVADSKEPTRMDDLNSYERFLVHEAVRDVAGVASRSVGEGNKKGVEIYFGEPQKRDDA